MNGLQLTKKVVAAHGGRFIGKHCVGVYVVYTLGTVIFICHSSKYDLLPKLTWRYKACKYLALVYGPPCNYTPHVGLPSVTVGQDNTSELLDYFLLCGRTKCIK